MWSRGSGVKAGANCCKAENYFNAYPSRYIFRVRTTTVKTLGFRTYQRVTNLCYFTNISNYGRLSGRYTLQDSFLHKSTFFISDVLRDLVPFVQFKNVKITYRKTSMGVFHLFWIVQTVTNRATFYTCYKRNSNYFLIAVSNITTWKRVNCCSEGFPKIEMFNFH